MKFIYQFAAIAALVFSSTLFATPVNINTASAEELAESLKGVGMSKAQAIVEYRKANGSFENAGDIVHVKGIGNSTYEKNKQDILLK